MQETKITGLENFKILNTSRPRWETARERRRVKTSPQDPQDMKNWLKTAGIQLSTFKTQDTSRLHCSRPSRHLETRPVEPAQDRRHSRCFKLKMSRLQDPQVLKTSQGPPSPQVIKTSQIQDPSGILLKTSRPSRPSRYFKLQGQDFKASKTQNLKTPQDSRPQWDTVEDASRNLKTAGIQDTSSSIFSSPQDVSKASRVTNWLKAAGIQDSSISRKTYQDSKTAPRWVSC
jgi:hypothetical protein